MADTPDPGAQVPPSGSTNGSSVMPDPLPVSPPTAHEMLRKRLKRYLG
jgi:hypothetical protein